MKAEDRATQCVREHLAKPIDMVLHCPACGLQHIDAPEPIQVSPPGFPDMTVLGASIKGEMNPERWKNPPHRSHLCHGCGHIWRPADVPTNGVQAVKTKGANDSPIPEPGLLTDCAKVGVEMVKITTTVQGRDEWPAIPELWLLCMRERDKAQGELEHQKMERMASSRRNKVTKLTCLGGRVDVIVDMMPTALRQNRPCREDNDLAADVIEQLMVALSDDTARLNHIEVNGTKHLFSIGGRWYARDGLGLPHRRVANLREAIDAAMKAKT